jgi:AcrR family transcriptional regulator
MDHKSIISSPPRDRLLRAAASVWAADPSAPLETVAAAAGVGRATLHRHFPTRVDLMRAAALDGLAALADAVEMVTAAATSPGATLDALIEALVPFGDRLHFLLVTQELLGDAALQRAEAQIDGPVRRVLDEAAAAGELRSDAPSAWRFRALEALLYASWTAVAEGDVARRDAPRLVREAFRRGFGRGPADGSAA